MKKIFLVIIFSFLIFSLTGCSKELKNEAELKKYAKKEIGHVEEFVSYEESDERNVLVVKDKLGFTYEVISHFDNMIIDGTNFWTSVETSTTFDKVYFKWLFQQVDMSKYPNLDISISEGHTLNGPPYYIYVKDISSTSDSISDNCFALCEEFINELIRKSKENYKIKSINLYISNCEGTRLGTMKTTYPLTEGSIIYKTSETILIEDMTFQMSSRLGDITYLYSEDVSYSSIQDGVVAELLESVDYGYVQKLKSGEEKLKMYVYQDDKYGFKFIILSQMDLGSGSYSTDYYYKAFEYFQKDIDKIKENYNLSNICIDDASTHHFTVKVSSKHQIEDKEKEVIKKEIMSIFDYKDEFHYNPMHVIFEK